MNGLADNKTTDQFNDLNQAFQFKKYLISYLDDYFKKNNTNQISLQDITSLTISSHYGQFLRNFFKIDSRSMLKRVHMFILSYPDQFKVNYEKGMVRFASEEDIQNLRKSIIDRCCEFLILCLSLQPNYMIPIKQLYDYLKYSAVDIEEYFENFESFQKFLEVYPDLFYLDENFVCSTNSQKKMVMRKYDIRKVEDTKIDDKLLEKVKFVFNLETGKRVKDHILSGIKVVAMDLEGTHLGENNGQLTLIQLAFIKPNIKLIDLQQKTIIDELNVYFFDILKCPELVKECIEPILERDDIIKVFHDTRNDFLALTQYFSVSKFKKVLDSSKIYCRLTDSKVSGLHKVYEEITGLTGQDLKPKMRQLYVENDAIWESRPLTYFLQFYAAMDVLAVITIYLYLESKYDLKNYDDIFIDKVVKPKDLRLVINSTNVVFDQDNTIVVNKNNKKKQNNLFASKKTPEEISQLKAKIEHLERIARGEISESDDD